MFGGYPVGTVVLRHTLGHSLGLREIACRYTYPLEPTTQTIDGKIAREHSSRKGRYSRPGLGFPSQVKTTRTPAAVKRIAVLHVVFFWHVSCPRNAQGDTAFLHVAFQRRFNGLGMILGNRVSEGGWYVPSSEFFGHCRASWCD